MSSNTDTPSTSRPGLFKNWISLAGYLLSAASLFSFVLLMVLDYFAKESSPYLGILTYIVAPAFLIAGLFLVGVGWWVHRRQRNRLLKGGLPIRLSIDLSLAQHRKYVFITLVAGAVLLLISSIGTYQTYHVTKTVQFCGTTCHEIMEPQYVTYQHSPHARVECTACHIAPGAEGFLKAKLGGLNQVYETITDKVQRPIKGYERVHIEQRTCEQCHWPARYVGDVERTFTHYLDDPSNTTYTVRLLLNVGGADPTHGPVGGIHYHMNYGKKIEYVASDPKKQKIPWVRVTDEKGGVREFRAKGFTNEIASTAVQTMNCMDCHNRPAHQFRTPLDAVETALTVGKISTNLPSIKKTAVLALGKPYASKDEAFKGIEAALREKYANRPECAPAIAEVQQIYSRYYFPAMKTDWSIYPNNIGHKDFPGCFRCHDDEHKTADGTHLLKSKDCNACHKIIGEERGSIALMDARGLKFKHPEEGWEDLKCNDCHNGKIDK